MAKIKLAMIKFLGLFLYVILASRTDAEEEIG